MPALASARTIDSARAGWDAWRASRLTSLIAPAGNLALVETRWQASDQDESLEDALSGRPSSVTATRLERRNIDTGELERGIRLWDANAPSIQHFDTVEAFPFNPDWVIEATFTEVPGSRRIPFEHIRDNGGTRELVVPGDITFTLHDVAYSLSAFDDDGTLLLVFGDRTNGVNTYAAGRFLIVPRVPGSDQVVLDFNRAFVPPCGFSAHYNCPLPPPQNRFHVAVDAGERLPAFLDGYAIH
ncbi:hypothetical protein SAMN05216276_104223 [Streptosporangium subroseum]|uniref:DUF1684 domain-containing protein n=1 Tax=Streptosporangium subroseum TaxID=106412 RepID=A0A239MKE7_9ACTN|nr:DUF1684 domain-containing protein [Streptosporangium subroseum]SNT42743.1 hypothetical protein SAMN05216276_104223 [Streptosporangium subroseum]